MGCIQFLLLERRALGAPLEWQHLDVLLKQFVEPAPTVWGHIFFSS